MFGRYSDRPGGGGETLPRVVQVTIDRVSPARPPAGRPHEFMVSIHEEGTALTWRHHAAVTPTTAAKLVGSAAQLHLWSLGLSLTPEVARDIAMDLARDLHRIFLGRRGAEVLGSLEPTAVLWCVDESVVNLPWELVRASGGAVGMHVPFGRVVTTGLVPAARRDPVAEDPTIRILVVANPSDDLEATAAELETLARMQGELAGVKVDVETLEGGEATRRGLFAVVEDQDFDIIHFAGHAVFDEGGPHLSAMLLADGRLVADDVRKLKWAAPPYIVFNSACESARASGGRRLVSARGHSNGLAAAFLAAGTEAYVGYYWPVGDGAAAAFADTFYRSVFTKKNIGTAVTEARDEVAPRFSSDVDLTAFGAIFFGDAGTAERRDLAMAV